jgi:hypothetical protein
MPGHVNESKPDSCVFQKSNAQVDGNTSAFFFGESIRIRAGERFHQGRFAVVYMPGSSNDHAFKVCGHER